MLEHVRATAVSVELLKGKEVVFRDGSNVTVAKIALAGENEEPLARASTRAVTPCRTRLRWCVIDPCGRDAMCSLPRR